MDQGNVADKGRSKNYTKNVPNKPVRPIHGGDDDENEPDPDWIEFDPEKEKGKFFGHVMEDESTLRNKVVA